MTTGPMHWELLLRSRANDNQIFVAGVSPARDPEASYVAWGHSMVVDPRYHQPARVIVFVRLTIISSGKLIAQANQGEESIVLAELSKFSNTYNGLMVADLQDVDDIRERIPITKQRRFDVYRNVAE